MARDIAKRAGSMFLAAIFLITTLGFTGLIYLQTKSQDNASSQEAALQEQLAQANQEQLAQQQALANKKLEGYTPITSEITKLQVKDLKPGSGQALKKGDKITAHYTGAFAVNGQLFGSSKESGEPLYSVLLAAEEAPDGQGLLKGWVDGLPGMKVGGTRRIILPAELAYGPAPEGYEPSPAGQPLGPLVFDIELISIN